MKRKNCRLSVSSCQLNVFLTLVLFFAIACTTNAQKYLQIEKRGSLKTTKIPIGTEIAFQTEGEWYIRTILDIRIEEGILIVEDGMVKIENITAIKPNGKKKGGKAIRNMLYNFGAGWLLFSLADALVTDRNLDELAAIVPASSFALGWTVDRLSKNRKRKIGKKWRLRLLDLSILAPEVVP